MVGNRTRVKVVKNKMAPPFREVRVRHPVRPGRQSLRRGAGHGQRANIVQKSGAWYSLDGERIGQGRDNARAYLEQHPELLGRLEQRVLEHHGIGAERKPEPEPAEPTPGAATAHKGAANGSAKRAASQRPA